MFLSTRSLSCPAELQCMQATECARYSGEEHPGDISRPTKVEGSKGGSTWQTLCLAGLEGDLAISSAHINHSWPGVGAHLSITAQEWKTAAWEGLGSD